MPKPLFDDLIKMLLKVEKPEDISFELLTELKTLTVFLLVKTYMGEEGASTKRAVENAKIHLNAYLEQFEKELSKVN